MRLCQFTGVGSSTEKSGRRELKVREAGEQGTGGGRFWPPAPPEYTWSVEWKSEHTWEPQKQQVNCLIKDPPKEPKLALRDSKQPDATRECFRCGGQFHGADNSRYNEGPLHFFRDVWMGIFALRETWMRIYFFRDSWIYIFLSYLGKLVFDFFVFREICIYFCVIFELMTFVGIIFHFFDDFRVLKARKLNWEV